MTPRQPFPLAVPPELQPYILDFLWSLELLRVLPWERLDEIAFPGG